MTRHATAAAAALLLGLPAPPLGMTGVTLPDGRTVDLQASSITNLIRVASSEEQLVNLRLEIEKNGHEASASTRRKWGKAYDHVSRELRAAAVSWRQSA